MLDRERDPAELEAIVGREAVKAVTALTATAVVRRDGGHFWASSCALLLDELVLIGA